MNDNQWILCSEKMPQPYEYVLVYPSPTNYLDGATVDNKGDFYYSEYERGFGVIQTKCEVTHWMPMPKPPITEEASK